MSTVTVSAGLARAARLIPFRAAGASRLTGDYGAVLSSWQDMPKAIRSAQRDRTAFYLSHTWQEGNRCKPDHAPRYYVTSYGDLIAWVTLDGRTHFADGLTMYTDACDPGTAQWRTMLRHRDAIRASWPDRFAMNSEGDPITVSTDAGRSWQFMPTGSREVCDRQGYVHKVYPDGACNICEGTHTDDVLPAGARRGFDPRNGATAVI